MWYVILHFLLASTAFNVKVGLLLPLSGPLSSYGKYCLEGIKLAQLSKPEITLVIKDNEGDPNTTLTLLREFADKGVSVIIGPVTSPNAIVAGIEANKFNIPIVLPAATNTALTRISKFLFRVCFTDKQQGKAIADFVFSKFGAEGLQIVADTSNIYSSALSIYVKQRIEELGGKGVFIEWSKTIPVPLLVSQLKEGIVFLPLYYTEVENIIKTARAKNLNITFVGADGWDAPELFTTLSEDSIPSYFSTHFFVSEKSKNFKELYTSKYNKEPNTFSALGFDALNLVSLAIKKSKTAKPIDIYAALLSIGTFEGVTGKCIYEGKKDPDKAIFILQLKNGKLLLSSMSVPLRRDGGTSGEPRSNLQRGEPAQVKETPLDATPVPCIREKK